MFVCCGGEECVAIDKHRAPSATGLRQECGHIIH
jgi:hypothetical protein